MITWTPTLETGHDIVDDDHKNLIGQLNALSEALHRGEGREQITAMIVFLNRYAREHFAREEQHMLQVGCVAYDENRRARAPGWCSRCTARPARGFAITSWRAIASCAAAG